LEDCIIVGAGPAGLTAAIYLARFHLSIRLFDCGTSRAALIPCTHNHAGFPDGITGTALLTRMNEQAARYGAQRELARVTRIEREDEGFVVWAEALPASTMRSTPRRSPRAWCAIARSATATR
jgi:thioredoxin reductase (NADPH)